MKYKYSLSKYKNPNMYSYGGQEDHTFIKWALCSHPAKGKVKQLSRFDTCREILCCRIFDVISRTTKRTIPTDKLRLVVKIASSSGDSQTQRGYQKTMDKWTKAATHMLNIIEKEHKWVLTKAYPIKPYSHGDKIYMLVASKKWMRSPHMLSLFTLIFRINTHRGMRSSTTNRLKLYKSIMKHIKKFSVEGVVVGDKSRVNTTIEYWDPLLRNYNKMFKGFPMKDVFNRYSYRHHAEEGINGLCSNRCTSHKLQERFNEVVKNQKVLREHKVFDRDRREYIVVGA